MQRHDTTRTVIKAFIVFLAILATAFLAVLRNPSTPFDEAAHWDYLEKVSSGVIPPVNDRYGQVVLSSIACSKSGGGEAWKDLEKCGSAYYTPAKAPFQGLSSATGYAPTYYLVTALPYKACLTLTTASKLPCARAANTLWLATSGAALFILGVLLGVGSWLSLSYAIGVTTIPSVLLQGATLNSDAASFALLPIFFIAAIMVNKSSYQSHRFRPWIILTAVATAMVTTKETLLPGVLIGFVYFVFNNIEGKPTGQVKKIWLRASVSVATLLMLSLVSRFLQGALRGIAGKADMDISLAIPLSEVPNSMALAIQESLRPYHLIVWPIFQTPFFQMVAEVSSVLAWISLASSHTIREASLSLKDRSALREFSFEKISIFLAWSLPAFLVVATWIGSHNAPVQPRYYMSTVMVLGLIGLASKNWKSLNRVTTALFLTSFCAVLSVLI